MSLLALFDQVTCHACAVPCRMHVRVLIPCYKEPLGVIQATVNAAISADLPEGVRR